MSKQDEQENVEGNQEENADSTPDNAPGGESPNSGEVAFSKEQQERIDKLVGDARVKAREKAQTEASDTAKKASDDAEAKRLEENEEFKTLSERHAATISEQKAQIAELNAKLGENVTEIEELVAVVKSQVESKREGLPEHIGDLLDNLTLTQQLAYIAKNHESLTAPQRGAGLGTPRTINKNGAPANGGGTSEKQHSLRRPRL